VVGCVSLVVRFRRATGVERQQLRWVAFAAVVAGIGFPVSVAGITINSPAVVSVGVLGSAAVLCLAIAAAILRYRLYDLDRIISRTLAYGVLTVLLGGGYAGVVLGLGLGQLLGRTSSLLVAGATLALAAVFQPAAAASRTWSTGASTVAATTPPGRSRRSATGCASRSTPVP
jgi:hypothetical protein